jgi:hypothetical protein
MRKCHFQTGKLRKNGQLWPVVASSGKVILIMKMAILGSWRTTLIGNSTGVLLFLQSWLSRGHKIDWHDPALLIGLALAAIGTIASDGVKRSDA